MAYSNTNRDKEQAKKSFSWANTALAVFGVIFALACLRNIWKQYQTLMYADSVVSDLSAKNQEIEQYNSVLEEEIKVATTSMGRKRNQVKYYGMGTSDDYWISEKIDNTQNNSSEKTEVSIETNWIKWWKLFTK